MQAASSGVNVSDLVYNIMKQRILFEKDNGQQETPLEAFNRVSRYVARGHAVYEDAVEVKRFEEQATEMMFEHKFMPNTPTLVNAGFENAQCSACFVLPVEDNLDSIYKAHYNQGLIQASGGGTGFFLGNIRSQGTKASGRLVTKGPINWLKMYNEDATHVAQGMREGANMAILDVSHPDIIEFITCKKAGYKINVDDLAEQFGVSVEEARRFKAVIGIEKFNISVSISDRFMQALEHGDEWYFRDPHTREKKGSIQAQELWNLIVANAYENGEPGLFFEDTANRNHVIPHIGRIRATNPCVTGDTLIQTDRGLERMEDFIEESRENAQVMGMMGQWRSVKEFMNNGVKPVWKVTTRSGYSVKATLDHKFPIVGQRELIKLGDLGIGQELYLQPQKGQFGNQESGYLDKIEDNELLGWIVGDGYLTSTGGTKAGLIVGNQDRNLLPWFVDIIENVVGAKCKPYERVEFNTVQLISRKIWKWAVNEMGAHPVKSKYKRVPESIWTATELETKAFIRGLFSADGHVRIGNNGSSIILTSKSRGLLEDVQILFSKFGCRTTILDRSRPARDKLFKHETKLGETRYYGSDGELHELFLYGDAKLLFRNEIGFTKGSYKQEKLEQIPSENNDPFKGQGNLDQIVSIEYIGEENVYDITVDDPKEDLTMINNGIVSWDCGEQPLLPYESCTLGHINLSKFVTGMNGTSAINWSELEDAIRFGMRFLDGVVEVNKFPIPELATMNRGTRRVGLGIMGWADLLAQMHIPYDSEDAINKASEVGEFFDNISLDENRKLGRDRGNFDYFEGSIFDGVEDSMRSSDRTTIAPTGTTSLYAMCSSGIEPLFSPVTVRNQAGMIQVDYHPALFEMLKERGLDTPEIREKLANIGGSIRQAEFLPEDIRHAFPTSHDIHYSWHVKHQIAWQKNITSAVSKTINLPHDCHPNDIDSAYRTAYEGGCKGITVYRDGTRMYQPLSTKKKDNESLIQIGQRASVTYGTNRKVANGCGNLMVYIGGSKEGVHEITARLGKGGGCASAQTESIARMASIAMQYGAPPEKVAAQLGGIRCHVTAMHRSEHTGNRPRIVTSCADAVSVALSEHLAELEDSTAELKETNKHVGACPNCGAPVAFEENCMKCYSCGHSRC